jgi:hypothetical protein
MSYRVIYNEEYRRVIPAVLIDSRANIAAIKTAGGFAVKAYTDSQVALVTDTVIPYKIETNEGNLAGYFNLSVSTNPKSAVLLNAQLRPAFVQFNSEISQIISNFIISNDWQFDYLF